MSLSNARESEHSRLRGYGHLIMAHVLMWNKHLGKGGGGAVAQATEYPAPRFCQIVAWPERGNYSSLSCSTLSRYRRRHHRHHGLYREYARW
jgi:hypothetical protein